MTRAWKASGTVRRWTMRATARNATARRAAEHARCEGTSSILAGPQLRGRARGVHSPVPPHGALACRAGMDRRIFGLENEYGVTCTLARPAPAEPGRGGPLPVPAGGQLGPVLQRVPGERGPPLPRRRAATPSTPPPSATPSPTWWSTTRRGSGSSSTSSTRRRPGCERRASAGVVFLFKNNTDSAGNSYGCHENYLTSRRDDFGHYAEVLIPFLVSRQIYAGSGKVLQTARGAMYCISQRAEHIWEGVSSATTRSRPDHQHPGRAPRRRRALSPAARDRRGLQHERVRHLPEGGRDQHPAAHARGPGRGAARHDPGEPHPGHPRDQPRHHPAGAGCGWPTAARPAPSTSRASTSIGPSATRRPRACRRSRTRPCHVGALPQGAGERPLVARPRVRLGDQAPA